MNSVNLLRMGSQAHGDSRTAIFMPLGRAGITNSSCLPHLFITKGAFPFRSICDKHLKNRFQITPQFGEGILGVPGRSLLVNFIDNSLILKHLETLSQGLGTYRLEGPVKLGWTFRTAEEFSDDLTCPLVTEYSDSYIDRTLRLICAHFNCSRNSFQEKESARPIHKHYPN